TSGGGLALMNEGVGLSGITETPLVITDVQRPGPATGLPTRTSQGDLLFAINSSQGEFPIMVTAPRNHESAFYNTFRVLNLADKYQIPVIILSDQFLADSATNIPEFDLDNLTIEHSLVDKNEYQDGNEYQRYEITENGISPRAYPGQIPGTTIVADSDEHDEKGHIVESAEQRKAMADKRARKEELLKEEDLKEPLYLGPEEKNIDYLLLGWGSTYGPLQEALELLQKDGLEVGYLSFTDIWPLPEKELKQWKDKNVQMINVENNSRGQFSRLLRQETGINVQHNILKYDGRPFSGQEIYARIKEEVIN
ncbi:MAG: 2-oxoacid:acceptor oxidoreductase subunit alpha, partial [Bacillota bacterium]